MKRIVSLALGAAVLLAAASCAKENTRISGVLEAGGNQSLVVKMLDVNRFETIDTLKVGEDGAFSYALALKEAQPEFIYLFYGEKPVASLLLQKGDEVKVHTDTLGNCSIEGSPESLELLENDKSFNAFKRDLQNIMLTEENPDAALGIRYVEYYRDRVAYVIAHSKSLAVVPVLFQELNPNMPIFGMSTDALLFRSVCDSLQTLYPESRFVKALDKEAGRRMDRMELNERLKNAKEVGFVDIELPGMDGKIVKLSEVAERAKAVMILFWASTAEQKMFNLDAVAPLYEEFHSKGFEIYAVSMDTDKASWAATVRNQKTPWVNVCDIRGAESPYVTAYGLESLPIVWFILDGQLVPMKEVHDAGSIRDYLRKKL